MLESKLYYIKQKTCLFDAEKVGKWIHCPWSTYFHFDLTHFQRFHARIEFDSFWAAWCKNSVWLVWCKNLFSFILRGLMQELILIYFEPELILILIHFERFDARIDCLWFDGITSVAGTSGHNIGWGYWIILNEQTNKHTLGDVSE